MTTIVANNINYKVIPAESGSVVVAQQDVVKVVIAQGGTSVDEKVRVSATDTSPNYLEPKLVAGTNITITKK